MSCWFFEFVTWWGCELTSWCYFCFLSWCFFESASWGGMRLWVEGVWGCELTNWWVDKLVGFWTDELIQSRVVWVFRSLQASKLICQHFACERGCLSCVGITKVTNYSQFYRRVKGRDGYLIHFLKEKYFIITCCLSVVYLHITQFLLNACYLPRRKFSSTR